MEGVVTKSTGSWYTVRTAEGQYIACRIKGKFRLDGVKHTNPVAVGDHVHFDLEERSGEGIIRHIEPRKNYMIRKASNLSKQTHIIASNLDQAMLVASIVHPGTSLGFIDRFLLTAEAYHIPAVIVFNKSDLCKGPLEGVLHDTVDMYRGIGYTCITCSAIKDEHVDEVRRSLAGKTTLLSGHSGVGKSSLLNAIEPGLQLRTGAVSDYSGKGVHTTTFAEMFELSNGGFIIDTPGIKEFGVVDIEPEELSHYFRDMLPYIGQCKFNNCKHVNEPGCAVMAAVQEGTIREERYASYLSILMNEDVFE